MRQVNSLNHMRWECKYHIVFIPKYRRKVLFGQIRGELGDIFHSLARQKESLIEEGHLMSDHVHLMILIPPKYAVAQVIGFIKGKSAIHIAQRFSGKKRNYTRQRFGLEDMQRHQQLVVTSRLSGILCNKAPGE